MPVSANSFGLPPPYFAPDELWHLALAELRFQMTKATFNLWLANSQVLAVFSNPVYLVVAVRNRYAQEWLTHRLSSVITRTLTSIADYQVEVPFISELCERDRHEPA